MKPLKFLIVEDDVFFARNLRKQLRSLGYEVVGTAGNLEDAREYFTDKNPDIIVMDIELADNKEGGIILAREFIKTKKIPIIYFTNFTDNKQLIQKAIGTAPKAILSKSSDIQDLIINIDNAIENNITDTVVDLVNNLELKKDEESFWIKSKDYYDRIFFNEICWLQTDD